MKIDATKDGMLHITAETILEGHFLREFCLKTENVGDNIIITFDILLSEDQRTYLGE